VGAGSGRLMSLAGALGVLAVVPLLVMQQGARQKVERSLQQSTKAIKEASKAVPPAKPVPAEVTKPAPGGQPSGPDSGAATPPPAPTAPLFTGRYRLGPEAAAVRVVVFSDYQCPDCKRLEGEITAKVRSDARFSLSTKQFPLSTLCNPHMPQDMHPDACWAARAAEVAGIMGGNEAFWKMTDWLFAHNGSFDEPTLRAFVVSLGFDAGAFTAKMESPEVAQRISADIEEAISLGIQGSSAPMIFINGVELKGWNAPDAFGRATGALLETNPPVRTAEHDRPPLAREKFLQDWAGGPALSLPESAYRHVLGSAAPVVRVVLIGDYLEPNTAEADRVLRGLAQDADKGVAYSYLHFPFDQTCNSGVPMTKHANACAAARLAEAAAAVGGNDGFWRAHAWLFEGQARTARVLSQGLATNELAQHLGVDAGALFDAAAAAGALVTQDIAQAQATGLTQLPWIIINGKVVRQWRFGKENLLPMLVEAARKP
jgi:protein-disulfide isomerase